MNRDDIRQKLIDGTIYVIANEGLVKASTKQIGLATSINEVYIYRLFRDKEDMFASAFEMLDEELFNKTMRHIDIMYMPKIEFEMRCRLYFSAIWNFLLKNRYKCLMYVQYFYSPYFTRHSASNHQKRFAPLIDKFKDAFIDEADIWMILNHILNVMLDFAVKAHNNLMPKKEIYYEHVFRVIYHSVEQYFKKQGVS